MTPRAWVLSSIAATCLVCYVVFFSGLFGGSPPVELLVRQAPARNGKGYDVTVGLSQTEAIQRVTVERVDDGTVTWQLEGEPASKPTKALRYGRKIKDMTEQVKAQPLQPGVEYRIVVVADSGTGQMQFVAKGRPG